MLPRDTLVSKAKKYAFNALAARAMTEDRLREKIMQKISPKDADEEPDQDILISVVDEVVALCRGYGFVDDASYARSRAASARRAGKSRRSAEMSMRTKGVGVETSAQAMAGYDERAAALSYLKRKKMGPFRIGQADKAREAKEFASFARQGFSYSLWREVADIGAAEADEIILQSEND